MKLELILSPTGKLRLDPNAEGWEIPETTASGLVKSFSKGSASGLLSLVREVLPSGIPDTFLYFRKFVKEFLTRLCHLPEPTSRQLATILLSIRPDTSYLGFQAMNVPPMRGAEYLTAEILLNFWILLEQAIQQEYEHFSGSFGECIRKFNPAWKQIGKVSFHLAENKQDTTGLFPFAFMATFIHRLSENDKPKHLPLATALQAYANDKHALLALLKPIQAASVSSKLIEGLLSSREIYHPIAWSAQDAFSFLQDIPKMEDAGVIVRIANLWNNKAPSNVQVAVKVDIKKGQKLGIEALLDFSVKTSLNGIDLTPSELNQLLNSEGGLIRIKGEWVIADPDKIKELLSHWDELQRATDEGVSFRDGMRLLAGAHLSGIQKELPDFGHDYSAIEAVGKLKALLGELENPECIDIPKLSNKLLTVLRPYQLDGVKWLWRIAILGLGGCLADDMGLGKTLQILILITLLRERGDTKKVPVLLVVPASLLKNWELESAKFTPELRLGILHPSAMTSRDLNLLENNIDPILNQYDAVVTTYGMLLRIEKLRDTRWSAVIIDEAQAIKNPQSKQSRVVRNLISPIRLALTGTPIENSITDLWSIFDFINPGLLGNVREFKAFINRHKTEEGGFNYTPVRQLTKPYILRRLKTDKRVITDLPDKTEIKVYCQLTKMQAVQYQKTVMNMTKDIETQNDIQRRGIIFKYLMAFKQICNHPAHYDGSGDYHPESSGKFLRLAEIVEEISSRQEKALVFTQFKEMTEPLHDFLTGCFGRPGLVLHGATAIKKRQHLVAEFQSESGPSFFVLSLKAAGVGLNLTAANHVIHFDRWWNPAVENQATDRAFRIGQHRNVLAHKFICKGTIEEKIDKLIEEKKELSDSLLSEGAEKLLTSMNNEELIKFVALDISATLD